MSINHALCRLCMNINCNLTPIFNEDSNTALEIYLITGVKVIQNTQSKVYICDLCHSILSTAMKLRNISQNSDKYFINLNATNSEQNKTGSDFLRNNSNSDENCASLSVYDELNFDTANQPASSETNKSSKYAVVTYLKNNVKTTLAVRSCWICKKKNNVKLLHIPPEDSWKDHIKATTKKPTTTGPGWKAYSNFKIIDTYDTKEEAISASLPLEEVKIEEFSGSFQQDQNPVISSYTPFSTSTDDKSNFDVNTIASTSFADDDEPEPKRKKIGHTKAITGILPMQTMQEFSDFIEKLQNQDTSEFEATVSSLKKDLELSEAEKTSHNCVVSKLRIYLRSITSEEIREALSFTAKKGTEIFPMHLKKLVIAAFREHNYDSERKECFVTMHEIQGALKEAWMNLQANDKRKKFGRKKPTH